MARQGESVGVVDTKEYEFGELRLDNGETLSPVTVAYETYGKLNEDKSNAILVCPPLTGDAHAAGRHHKNQRKKGWYDIAVGPKKTFDTDKYFVISTNVIGGCRGSTGPSSINPDTGQPYGLDFPYITVSDMVRAQKKLIDHLGIKKLFAVTGGSLGGMQAIQWTIDYPETVKLAIPVATAAKQYPMAIALHEAGRQAIKRDPNWNKGDYYGEEHPEDGLAVARQIGHISYLSQETFQRKFDRDRKDKPPAEKFGIEFEVQSYLDYQGRSFVDRFDANSYLYITHATDQFDLTEGGQKRLKDVFQDVKARFLLVSFTSDRLYPPWQVRELFQGLAEAGVSARYEELDLPYGHDAFLVYNNTLGNTLLDFLEEHEKDYLKTPFPS